MARYPDIKREGPKNNSAEWYNCMCVKCGKTFFSKCPNDFCLECEGEDTQHLNKKESLN